jgi:hypothetical protein
MGETGSGQLQQPLGQAEGNHLRLFGRDCREYPLRLHRFAFFQALFSIFLRDCCHPCLLCGPDQHHPGRSEFDSHSAPGRIKDTDGNRIGKNPVFPRPLGTLWVLYHHRLLLSGRFGPIDRTLPVDDRDADRNRLALMMNDAIEIAKMLGLPKNEIENVRKAVILHDIGKVGINESILLKNSKLTEGEFETMKKHPQLSTDLIRPLYFLRGTVPLILYHYERWDGKGYPHRLKGKEIPIGARIIAIVDAYRSLTSNRPYRKVYSKSSAIKILRKESGTKFDPQVTAAFLKILNR